MGPELMIASAVASAASTMIGAVSSSNAMNAQASADKERASIEAAWTQRRANETRGAGQQQSLQNLHEMKLAQSKLTTQAAASGGAASDPTVMNLMGDIEAEGRLNAGRTMAGAEQKAQGMEHQAALDLWTADANSRIKKSSANATLIGGMLGAAGEIGKGAYNAKLGSPMASRYGGGEQSYRYG